MSRVSIALLVVAATAWAQQNLRAWHTGGQTFLLWQHSHSVPADTCYDIYASSQPINTLHNASWLGRVFANDGANSRLALRRPAARWLLPDTLGGLVTVGLTQAYFVATPHSAGTAYYAVVLQGDTTVGSGNTAGPVAETLGGIRSLVQFDTTDVTVYGHWIDGRADHESGRPDYQVMGNQYSNGVGYCFAIWRHPPGTNLPLCICLHGGGGNLLRSQSVARLLPSGVFVSLDDPIYYKDTSQADTIPMNTFWYGYRQKLNRFDAVPPDSADSVIDYTVRRVLWEIGWLVRNQPVDPSRISLMGMSMGANGTLFISQFLPEAFSAALAFVPGGVGPMNPFRYRLLGTEAQNLPTNIRGSPGIYDVFNWDWRMQHIYRSFGDWPFTLICSGRHDTVLGWSDKPYLYRGLDSLRTGFALYWDERQHTVSDSAHWDNSEHLEPGYLARFRRNQSFPAFSASDVYPFVPGRQPDPGNGDTLTGDPWGTWGGYFEWDTATIEDQSDLWAATLWVKHQSQYPNDIPDSDTIRVNVTPRRAQRFQPAPGASCLWRLTRLANGETLQSGTAQADPLGEVLVPGLLLLKEATRLRIDALTGISDPGARYDGLRFEVKPNPVSGFARVSFELPKAHASEARQSRWRLAFYSANGRLNRVWPEGLSATGQHALSLNTRGLSPGVYLLRLETSSAASTRKLTVE